LIHQRFFTEGNSMALFAQKPGARIAFAKGRQKLRMNPMRNFTQSNTILLEKTCGCV